MPARPWKPTLAAGVLLTGAGATATAQPPAACPPAAGPCLPAYAGSGWGTAALARGSLLHPRPWPDVPFGASVALHHQAQITNAVATRMALYDFDFARGTDQLNYRGRERVRQIAGWAAHNQFPVVVEWLPHAPDVAERRRMTVLAELTAVLGPVPAERVVVAGPGPTTAGIEAEAIYMNLLRLTESAGTVPGTGVRGAPSGAATGGATGTGGGGLGAPTAGR